MSLHVLLFVLMGKQHHNEEPGSETNLARTAYVLCRDLVGHFFPLSNAPQAVLRSPGGSRKRGGIAFLRPSDCAAFHSLPQRGALAGVGSDQQEKDDHPL